MHLTVSSLWSSKKKGNKTSNSDRQSLNFNCRQETELSNFGGKVQSSVSARAILLQPKHVQPKHAQPKHAQPKPTQLKHTQPKHTQPKLQTQKSGGPEGWGAQNFARPKTAGFHTDRPRTLNVHISGSWPSKTQPKFHEKTQEREERKKIVPGEVKKGEILGGPGGGLSWGGRSGRHAHANPPTREIQLSSFGGEFKV